VAHFELIQADILKLDIRALLAERKLQRLSIAANLPYYITTPVIAKLLEEEVPFERMVALTQWEVAERLCSAPGAKAYAAISVLVQFCVTSRSCARCSRALSRPLPRLIQGSCSFSATTNRASTWPIGSFSSKWPAQPLESAVRH